MKKTYKAIFSIILLVMLSLFLVSCSIIGVDTNELTPYIGENGNWWIGETDLGVSAQGSQGLPGTNGEDGNTPFIGENGNWWIGETDLGVSAQGPQGLPGTNGSDGIDGKDGTSLLTGEGLPDVSLGKDGDSYIDVNTWDYYSKINGEWIFINNMNNTNHTHTFVSEVTNSTCVDPGSVVLTCTTCGHIETSTISPTGHTYGAWIETKLPTCNEEGLKKRVCLTCNHVEEETISAHEHSYTVDYLYDTSTHWNICIYCGIRENEESHVVGDTTCSVCGYRFPASYPVDGDSVGLIFALSEDETSYILIDIGTFEGTELIIPSIYNELPVTGFVAGFAGSKEITSIVFPDTIKELPKEGLKGFSTLNSVILPSEITEIPDSFFEGCSSLKNVVIPDSVTSIGGFAFSGCSSLTSITIPDSVTSIGSYGFGGCWSLTSITIPESVTSIGDGAFIDCSSLTHITIPESVTSIESYAFYNCSSLTSVVFENVNNWFANGKIYKEQLENPSTAAKLLTNTKSSSDWYCSKLVYTLNDDKTGYVVELSNLSFSTNTSFVIPSIYNELPVTSIKSYAFSGCSSLTSITIPDSVTTIGNGAFYNCSNLTSIIYEGTMEQWNNIEKGYDWNYNTGSYVIHCTNGNIDK